MTEVGTTDLGTQGLVVSRQGFGAMGMSHGYGAAKPEEEMIELLRYAINSGITFIDTSDVYGPHTNEILVGKAIKGLRHKVQLATKFGINLSTMGVRGDPAYIRESLEGSLKRLDVDYIDLYYQHRIDPSVPIEISIGVLKEYVEGGKIKYIGLSEACAADIRRAHAVHPITAIQIEYSLWTRDVEEDIIPTCRELGIGVVAYSPLGRGFFSGVSSANLEDGDFRKRLPRFKQENFDRNRTFYEKLVAIGKKKNAAPGQLALAWVEHQGRDIVAIPGTTKRKNLDENVKSLAVHLSKDELKELEDAVPHDEVAGERYPESFEKLGWKFVSTPPLTAWDHETQKLRPDWSQ